MATRVFIQNDAEGDPWYWCGNVGDKNLSSVIGQYAQSELENANGVGDKKVTLSLKLVEMSDEEVATLPEV